MLKEVPYKRDEPYRIIVEFPSGNPNMTYMGNGIDMRVTYDVTWQYFSRYARFQSENNGCWPTAEQPQLRQEVLQEVYQTAAILPESPLRRTFS